VYVFLCRKFATLTQNKNGYEDPKWKISETSRKFAVFKEFFLGLASFRQSVLPCRKYVEGFPEFSTCLSDLSPNFTKSSPPWRPVHLILKIEKKKTLVHSFGELPLMQQLYTNILADAPCVCGVIQGPVVAGFFLGKSLGAKMAISDVQIMAIIHRKI
jgi:hypothetical protein